MMFTATLSPHSLNGRQLQLGVLVLDLGQNVCEIELTLAHNVRGTDGDRGKRDSPYWSGHLTKSHNHRVTGPLFVRVHN